MERRQPGARLLFLLCLALLLVFTAACEIDPALPSPPPVPVATATDTSRPLPAPSPAPLYTPIAVGRFDVDLVYRRQASYARGMSGSDEESRWSPYFRQVIEPAASFFAGYDQPAQTQVRWTTEGAEVEPSEYTRLAEAADAGGLAEAITGTLAALNAELPDLSASIYVFAGLPTLADGAGSTGPGARRVALIFNTDTLDDSDDPGASWRAWLPYHLRRELYVVARLDKMGRGAKGRETLLDLLIDYGLADSFAREAYPNLTPPWRSALSPEQERQVWPQMEPLLDSYERARHDLFVGGSPSGTVPPWSAFTVGYNIVAAYMDAHPGTRAADLLATRSVDILAGSGYSP